MCVPVGALEALGSFRAVFAEVVVGAVESVLFESVPGGGLRPWEEHVCAGGGLAFWGLGKDGKDVRVPMGAFEASGRAYALAPCGSGPLSLWKRRACQLVWIGAVKVPLPAAVPESGKQPYAGQTVRLRALPRGTERERGTETEREGKREM